jgi:hypothetical protein
VQDFRAAHGGRFLAPFIEQQTGSASFGNVALVGFSAGCWGIREILSGAEDASQVSLVYACDGLHGYYSNGQIAIQEPWLRFADRAVESSACMVVSFSAIVPPGYPGTKPSAEAMAARYAMGWTAPSAIGQLGVQQAASRGALRLYGAWPAATAGTDAAAHVYQVNQVQEAVWREVIAPWMKGSAASGAGGGSGTGATKTIGIAAVAASAALLAWHLYKRRRGRAQDGDWRRALW